LRVADGWHGGSDVLQVRARFTFRITLLLVLAAVFGVVGVMGLVAAVTAATGSAWERPLALAISLLFAVMGLGGGLWRPARS
jgi:uncharacterized membrane protein YqjE